MGDVGYLPKEVRDSADLQRYFEDKLKEWERSKGEKAHKTLVAKLINWGSRAPGATLWDALKNQILFQAERQKISRWQFVDNLFQQENADMFMALLQA